MNTKDNTLHHIALGLYSYRGWYIRESRSLVAGAWVEVGPTAASVMLHKGVDMCAGKAADACKLVDRLIKEVEVSSTGDTDKMTLTITKLGKR